MADATAELAARLLTAEAALVCRPFAGAVALAAGAANGGRLAVPRGHLARVGGVPLLDLLRVAGVAPVEVGDVDGYAPEELATAEAALLVGVRSGMAEIASTLWACRAAGIVSIVVAGATAPPLALLDAGADLVAIDVAELYGGPPTGVVAGASALVAACSRQRVSALFRALPDECAATLAALQAAAGDPAAGAVMPLAG